GKVHAEVGDGYAKCQLQRGKRRWRKESLADDHPTVIEVCDLISAGTGKRRSEGRIARIGRLVQQRGCLSKSELRRFESVNIVRQASAGHAAEHAQDNAHSWRMKNSARENRFHCWYSPIAANSIDAAAKSDRSNSSPCL